MEKVIKKTEKYLKIYQVLPLSSQIRKLYPSEVLIGIDGKKSKAMSDQLTTVSELRFMNKIGDVKAKALEEEVQSARAYNFNVVSNSK